MARGNIVAGIDIGSHSIKALVVQKKLEDWEVLSYAEVPSFGLRRGAVVSVEEASRNIQMIVSGIEKDCGKKINSAFVNIGGSHLYVIPSDGIISVSRADQKISEEDIDRVLQTAQAINISSNDQVIKVFPREFIIDGQKGIKDPEGLMGFKLEAKVLLLCGFAPSFINLTQSVLSAKLQINDVIPSPLAAANAVLTPQQKELGVALIDIGASVTSLSVFEEGDLIHLAVFPIGSAHITSDIAIGLRTEVPVAESIKKQYGTCMLSKIDKDKKDQAKKKIEIFDKSDSISFTKKNLVDIFEPRVSEIFDQIQKELKKINKQESLPCGAIITGGGSKIPKIKDLAKETLKIACEIGKPKNIIGLEEDPSLATVVGLVLEGINSSEGGDFSKGLWIKIGYAIKKWFKSFLP